MRNDARLQLPAFWYFCKRIKRLEPVQLQPVNDDLLVE